MASIRREISLKAAADDVWAALRDFDQVHARVAPGFLTSLEMKDGDRVVTFFNGLVARERLVTLDDDGKRLVYSIVDGRPKHHNASFEVVDDGNGGSRIVWTADLLPNELAPAIAAMMDQGLVAMKKTLDA
ncbi:MAG: SRPBCC family protein [Alphaproteobacteria bacterium]|nr:SRPBCC family protein [Alphaproteobacteria bacterium]